MFIFLGLIFWGWQSALSLFALIVSLSLFEFYDLSPNPMPRSWKWFGMLTGLAIFGVGVLTVLDIDVSPLMYFIVLPAVMLVLLVFTSVNKPFEAMAWMVLGWFYLISPWLCMVMMVDGETYNPWIYFGLFGMLWAADTGAYTAGKTLGKTKLLPRVSPKKTWEGLIGGLLSACLLAWIVSHWITEFSLYQWVILAISTSIFGTLGDLAESVLKRSLDVKDSGTMLPGHGGILDRFDGLFVAAPMNALLVYFFH